MRERETDYSERKDESEKGEDGENDKESGFSAK